LKTEEDIEAELVWRHGTRMDVGRRTSCIKDQASNEGCRERERAGHGNMCIFMHITTEIDEGNLT
jgi:hypothetical protein